MTIPNPIITMPILLMHLGKQTAELLICAFWDTLYILFWSCLYLTDVASRIASTVEMDWNGFDAKEKAVFTEFTRSKPLPEPATAK